MMQKWNILYSSNDKIVWINYIDNEIKICYLTYKDEKTPLPKGWERWFSTTYQLFYYRYIDDNGREQIQWKSPKTSNQYNYSPKMKPSTVINLDLKDDLKKIYDMNGNVSLIYEGINIPCTINIHDTKIEIKIVGKEDDCLDFKEDLWSIKTHKIYPTAQKLANLTDLISVNSFGQVLHLVTPKGRYSADEIAEFLKNTGELDIEVSAIEATIEDVFMLFMTQTHTISQ